MFGVEMNRAPVKRASSQRILGSEPPQIFGGDGLERSGEYGAA